MPSCNTNPKNGKTITTGTPKGFQRFCWHRDLPYLQHSTANLLTAMLCLDPMTQANGATVVLRGSHRDAPDQPNDADQDIAEAAADANEPCEPVKPKPSHLGWVPAGFSGFCGGEPGQDGRALGGDMDGAGESFRGDLRKIADFGLLDQGLADKLSIWAQGSTLELCLCHWFSFPV